VQYEDRDTKSKTTKVGIKANTSIKAYLMKINGKTPGKKSQGDKS
jgi:hypothetical protein